MTRPPSVALLAEGVDRNKYQMRYLQRLNTSPSSRRAWIEICRSMEHGPTLGVALLAEGVDRNLLGFSSFSSSLVALLAEGVDRNQLFFDQLHDGLHVALLAEGVDRNEILVSASVTLLPSPSSRRAWIEIASASYMTRPPSVALLAEGVDRNSSVVGGAVGDRPSPSSRRAWIEITGRILPYCLRPGSPSSRRAWIEIRSFRALLCRMSPGRPPRGGRG